ncbi:acylneuraminate cytidylyltransferase family protein [Nitrosopumilus sp.]|nr:acylneuraminate cytidylyltransferase family protein [Nitrosopumilus sp.]
MEILAIIPARGGSKGIPFKNIIKIGGKPLLYYTVNAALKSKLITRTIVSTDNEKISKIAKFYGSEVIKRPKKLSGDKIGLEPTISHVLDSLNEKEKYVPDLIIILQNTSPLRNSRHIDEALKLLIKNKFDSILSGFSYYTFLWNYKNNNTVKSITYTPEKRPNHQNMKEQLYENGALFVSTIDAFKNSNCRISGKIGFYKMPIELSYNIDTLEDLKDVKRMMKLLKNDYL